MKDCRNVDIKINDFVIYCTKTEAPRLSFGRVQRIEETTDKYGKRRICVEHCHPDGTPEYRTRGVFDPNTGAFSRVTTDKTTRAWLSSHAYSKCDARILVTEPIK
jgi:hypothetical protein